MDCWNCGRPNMDKVEKDDIHKFFQCPECKATDCDPEPPPGAEPKASKKSGKLI